MNKLTEGIKQELKGWTALEIVWIIIATIIILGVSIYWKDNWVGITSALTGVWCVIFTGKGKRSSFIFGMVNVLCYIYVSYNEKFYGEVMLNALYYVPMNVVGWIAWSKHINKDNGEVVKEKLKLKTSILIYVVTFVSILVYGFLLKLVGGTLPYIDSMSTVVAIVAQVMSVRRLTEQWILWIVVNVVSVIMWGISFAQGGDNIATLAMWSVYLVNAIIMYIKWQKEAKICTK